jgi:hypothetical protein
MEYDSILPFADEGENFSAEHECSAGAPMSSAVAREHCSGWYEWSAGAT